MLLRSIPRRHIMGCGGWPGRRPDPGYCPAAPDRRAAGALLLLRTGSEPLWPWSAVVGEPLVSFPVRIQSSQRTDFQREAVGELEPDGRKMPVKSDPAEAADLRVTGGTRAPRERRIGDQRIDPVCPGSRRRRACGLSWPGAFHAHPEREVGGGASRRSRRRRTPLVEVHVRVAHRGASAIQRRLPQTPLPCARHQPHGANCKFEKMSDADTSISTPARPRWCRSSRLP